MTRFFRTPDHVYFPQTNLLKDIKTYLKAAANRETELMKKQQELEEKVCINFVSIEHSLKETRMCRLVQTPSGYLLEHQND